MLIAKNFLIVPHPLVLIMKIATLIFNQKEKYISSIFILTNNKNH